MKKPKFTDAYRGRYRSAAETAMPGYMQGRMKIYARRERMRVSKQRKNDAEVAQKVVGIIKTKKAGST